MKNKILKFSLDKPLRITVFAAATAMLLTACGGGDKFTPITIVEAFLDTQAAQVGGATAAVTYYKDSGNVEWTLYSMANRFAATPIVTTKGSVTEITVPGNIEHITLVSYNSQSYALLSMGEAGIGVVNISNPATMVYQRTMTVDYDTPAYPYVDGGGTRRCA